MPVTLYVWEGEGGLGPRSPGMGTAQEVFPWVGQGRDPLGLSSQAVCPAGKAGFPWRTRVWRRLGERARAGAAEEENEVSCW